jgi:uncharacterized membrane protein
MPLALKAHFYAIAIPLVTTTGVVQTHRRKNRKNIISVRCLYFLVSVASEVFVKSPKLELIINY